MNKRLLAGLLAVSTAITTIAINSPSSYAAPRIDSRTGQWVDEAADGTLWIVKKVGQVWRRVRRANPKPPDRETIQKVRQFGQKFCQKYPESSTCKKK